MQAVLNIWALINFKNNNIIIIGASVAALVAFFIVGCIIYAVYKIRKIEKNVDEIRLDGVVDTAIITTIPLESGTKIIETKSSANSEL